MAFFGVSGGLAVDPLSLARVSSGRVEENEMDFEHSERAQRYMGKVERFVRERIQPSEPL